MNKLLFVENEEQYGKQDKRKGKFTNSKILV